MIDTKMLLNSFDLVVENLTKRGLEEGVLQRLREAVQSYKNLKSETEQQQAKQNKLSKDFASNASNLAANKQILLELKESIKQNRAILDERLGALNELLLQIPNLIDDATPPGLSEEDNVEISRVLSPPSFDFTPKPHWELARQNGWIDSEAGVKLAKSRFSVLRGFGARLNHALISYMLAMNAKAGFEICSVPVIANEDCLLGTGQLPKFAADMFEVGRFQNDDEGQRLYLISTSEIALTNLYRDSIIPIEKLPLLLTAHTPCFRREAGSAGKDTRGLIRQHQFDKVEIVAITKQEDSQAMQQKMVSHVSSILESLGLPHRLVQLCSGDIGFSAQNTIDLEVWLPGQQCYREISSVSNCGDFQARRAMVRYKDGAKNKLAHTLNGSSLAVGRTLVAIMENFQQDNGEIKIPEVLEKYLL